MKESTKTIVKWMQKFNKAEAENKELRKDIQSIAEQALTRKEGK